MEGVNCGEQQKNFASATCLARIAWCGLCGVETLPCNRLVLVVGAGTVLGRYGDSFNCGFGYFGRSSSCCFAGFQKMRAHYKPAPKQRRTDQFRLPAVYWTHCPRCKKLVHSSQYKHMTLGVRDVWVCRDCVNKLLAMVGKASRAATWEWAETIDWKEGELK